MLFSIIQIVLLSLILLSILLQNSKKECGQCKDPILKEYRAFRSWEENYLMTLEMLHPFPSVQEEVQEEAIKAGREEIRKIATDNLNGIPANILLQLRAKYGTYEGDDTEHRPGQGK